MADAIDLQKIAETNPGIDVPKLERFREAQKLLEQAGVVRKADYRLAPPLGGASQERPKDLHAGMIRMT